MAVMKKRTRRKLSKQLNKLIKLHGAEMALALVTGVVSALAAEHSNKADRKKGARGAKPAKAQKAGKPARAARAAKPPARVTALRKRA